MHKTIKLGMAIWPLWGAVSVPLIGGCARTNNPAMAETERAEDALARARSALDAGELDEARAAFEAAIERNPSMAEAHLGIGDLHQLEGDLPAAAEAYANATRLSPREFEAHYKHGLVLHLLDRLGEAVRAYLAALRLTPDDFDANLNLATAYLQLGEPEQGVPFAERAVELRPTSGPARVNLGALYSAIGRNEDAAESYLLATEYTEPTPSLLLSLADSQAKSGALEAARFTLERLTNQQPSALAWERLGSIHFRMRDYPSALEAFRESLRLDARSAPALNGLAVCRLNEYLWSGKTDLAALEEARSALRESLRINARQPRIKELLTRFG